MPKYLDISIKSKVLVDDRLQRLIQQYGEKRVAEALGNLFEYEVIRNIGDVYRNAIVLTEGDIDALEEMLS